jgi:uncharacterized protein DUF1707
MAIGGDVGSVSISKTAGAQSPQLRIGDAERQEAARQLQQHFADGRLTWEELDERLQTAYAARLTAELTPLFADLPDLPPPPPPPATVRSRAEGLAGWARRRDVRALMLWTFLAVAIVTVLEWHFVPIVLIWAFVVFGHRSRHHHHRGFGHHHGR